MPSFFGFHFQQQVTPYVILFIERDGSTYLTSLLASHPNIKAVYEHFAVMNQKGQGAQEQLDWARNFLTPPLVGKSAAMGFKTKLVDVLDQAGFARLLQEQRVHILQMQRQNHVKAVVSRINARRLHDASGKWNLYKEEDRMPPMSIDLAEFDTFLKERELAELELEVYMSRLRLPMLKIVYEDFLRERNATIQRVFSFLRVRPMPVEGKTLKHTSDNLREVILNFDELRARYAETAYETMFDETIVSSAM